MLHHRHQLARTIRPEADVIAIRVGMGIGQEEGRPKIRVHAQGRYDLLEIRIRRDALRQLLHGVVQQLGEGRRRGDLLFEDTVICGAGDDLQPHVVEHVPVHDGGFRILAARDGAVSIAVFAVGRDGLAEKVSGALQRIVELQCHKLLHRGVAGRSEGKRVIGRRGCDENCRGLGGDFGCGRRRGWRGGRRGRGRGRSGRRGCNLHAAGHEDQRKQQRQSGPPPALLYASWTCLPFSWLLCSIHCFAGATRWPSVFSKISIVFGRMPKQITE